MSQHMFAQNNRVIENEPQAVRKWREIKFCFGFIFRYGFRKSASLS